MELTKIQQEAVFFINNAFNKNINPICALGPGLGKTFVACEIITQLINKNDNDFKILLVHKAVLYDEPWHQTLSKFGLTDNDFIRLYGSERQEYLINENKYYFPKRKIIITSYDTLHNDLAKERYDLSVSFNLIVFDELQTIINYSKVTQKFLIIAKINAHHKLALSGTPIQNHIEELGFMYFFLNFIDSRMQEKLQPFINRCAYEITNSSIRLLLLDDGIFCKFEEIGSEKTEVILSLPIQKEVIQFIRSTFKNNINDRLKFLSHPCSTRQVIKNNDFICTKLETVKLLLKTIPSYDKIIIFSRYIDVLDCYYNVCKENNFQPIKITGKEKGKELTNKLFLFENSNFRVLLTTLQKSSEGLNLQCANHIIILDLWWNPQKIFQAMSRIKRIGQQKKIFIYILCNNENGKIINEEASFYATMVNKNEITNYIYTRFGQKSNKIPDLKIFNDTNIFIVELTQYLDSLYQPDHIEKDIIDSISFALREDLGYPLDKSLKDAREKIQKAIPRRRNKIYYQKIQNEKMRAFFKYYFSGNLGNSSANDLPADEIINYLEQTGIDNELLQELSANKEKRYIPEGSRMQSTVDPDEIDEVKNEINIGGCTAYAELAVFTASI